MNSAGRSINICDANLSCQKSNEESLTNTIVISFDGADRDIFVRVEKDTPTDTTLSITPAKGVALARDVELCI